MAGKNGWLKAACNREKQVLLPPRERLLTMPAGLPEYTLGYSALAWMELNLRVASGRFAGVPFRCSQDQALFLLWFYAVDKAGRWVARRAVRRYSKGSGKSPFAAALALFELVGDCRVDRFDSSVPGGVIGRAAPLPLVQIAATSERQTAVTMRQILGFAHKRTAIAKKYELDIGKTYVDTPTGGKLQLLTSSASSAEGHEPSLVICDETEHWTPNNGGVDLWHTLRRNLGKTGNRMLETCNAWSPGRESVAEKSFEDWCSQEEGTLIDEHGVTLYDARIAPFNTVLTDTPGKGEIGLTQALNFVYETQPWVDIEPIKQEIWSPSMPPNISRQFYLNQPTVVEDAWVEPKQWSALADTERELRDGEDIVLFFDGSKSNDHTALVGCCMDDGFIFTIGVWAPEKPLNIVDVNAVDAAVRKTHEQFNVVAFFSDVREWESFAKVTWCDIFKDTIILPAQKNGRSASLVAWDMRSHSYEFACAAEMCKAEIENTLFTHDGNWITARHISNCRMSEYRGHITVKKESPKSPKKIDAAVCVIGARMVYRIVKESQEYASMEKNGNDWWVF